MGTVLARRWYHYMDNLFKLWMIMQEDISKQEDQNQKKKEITSIVF
jgi:hypothetical protein